jgi:plastocyanin
VHRESAEEEVRENLIQFRQGTEQRAMKLRTVLPAMLALTAFTAACSSDKAASPATSAAPGSTAASATTAAPATTVAPVTTAGATTAATTAAAGAAAATGAVEIKQFKFGPAEIHVPVGGTVTWTNSDNQRHTATASGTFDTGGIDPGSSASHTFDTAGTFAFICSFHPFMQGTVVVGS